jgi:hypothetical protein
MTCQLKAILNYIDENQFINIVCFKIVKDLHLGYIFSKYGGVK